MKNYISQCTNLSKNTNWTCGPADQIIDWTTQNLTGPQNSVNKKCNTS